MREAIASDIEAMTGVRALDERGGFSAPTRVSWASGRFKVGAQSEPADFDGTGFWIIPGLVDAHVHAAWHAFDAQDRAALDEAATQTATADALRRLLAAGFTSVRDAGGLTVDALTAVPEEQRPRAQLSVQMIDRATADAAGGIDAAVQASIDAGASWIKLVATAGVASPAGTGLDPVFSAAEVGSAVQRAGIVGARVMVHAWGGQAIDDAIAAGAESIEHGIFLTEDQAKRAARRGMTLVPTLRVYRLVQQMIDAGSLPASFRARVDEAVGAHPNAVRRARDAGLAIAVGTDSGTPDQHASGTHEFDALVGAGLTHSEALIAVTTAGAQLLARTAAPGTEAPEGRIAARAVADGVILREDPRTPGVLSDPASIAAVIRRGRIVDPPPNPRVLPTTDTSTFPRNPHPREDRP